MDLTSYRFCVITALLTWCVNCKLVLSKVEITCFCNTPSCFDQGRTYCTSYLGKCFIQNWYQPDQEVVYGCVDELGPSERTICMDRGDVLKKAPGLGYFLTCCEGREGDVCNEPMEQPPIDVSIEAGSAENQSALLEGEAFEPSSTDKHTPNYAPRELWFKAAVIAVPIAGGFILILLVLLAVRMLRQDSRHHRQMKHNQSLAKAQHYVADHFYNPNNHLLYNYSEEEKLAEPDFNVVGRGGGPYCDPSCVHSNDEPCVCNNELHVHKSRKHLSKSCSVNNGHHRSIHTGVNTQKEQSSDRLCHVDNNTQKYSYDKLTNSNNTVGNPDNVVESSNNVVGNSNNVTTNVVGNSSNVVGNHSPSETVMVWTDTETVNKTNNMVHL